ncbi:MAG: uracil-DNA glycosylase [Candidatus Cloacimonetes bacterium]|jgi:DNA polymerase|nr:uracil-DNA glycosylase [Candidatus Cloacimonadota bacterium]
MDLEDFDWEAGPDYPYREREIIYNWDIGIMGKTESSYERKLRMLKQLSLCCSTCTCCELGRKDAERNGTCRDPHVLSNMNPTRLMIVGQGPGWDEITKGTPFIGASGKNFDDELKKNGIDRSLFYITNTIKCFVEGNAKPNYRQVQKCKPFLMMEIGLINPLLVITLGASAFEILCPNAGYSQSLGTITKSEEFGVKVFAAYHPSPLNLADRGRRLDFEHHIAILAKLIKRISTTDE